MTQVAASQRHAGPFKKTFKIHEQAWHIAKFDPVRSHIQSVEPSILDKGNDSETNKLLARVCSAVEEGQDEVFGVSGSVENRKIMTKIPAKLFADFSPGGGLSLILISVLKYAKGHGWGHPEIEGNLTGKQTALEHVRLFTDALASVTKAGLVQYPCIFIDPSISKDERDALAGTIEAHQGKVAPSLQQATHELVKDAHPDDDGTYCRSVEAYGKVAMVHWWFHPESYREWVPSSVIQGSPEAPMPLPKRWRVYARFVRDTGKFNEWVCEEDYAVVEGGGGDVGGKRKREDVEADGGVKRINVARPRGVASRGGATTGASEASAGGGGSGAQQQQQQQHSDKAQQMLRTYVEASKPFGSKEGQSGAVTGKKGREATGDAVVMPSYSGWFRFEQIHMIEKRAMPEWFKGDSASKTPRAYVEARDFIINFYREAPRRYLTATECRRHIAVDVCSVIRLHAFLEHWGLINYNVDTGEVPSIIGPVDTTSHPILLAMPDGSLLPKEQALMPGSLASPSGPELITAPTSRLVGRANTFAAPQGVEGGAASGGSERYVCAISGEDCSRERYHCIADPQIVISPAKFAASECPEPYSASDFVRVVADSDSGTRQDFKGVGDWGENETCRLLEGVEQFGDDWAKVVAHVGGTKTKEQCITHFLRLPIEDAFIDSSVKDKSGSPSSSSIMSQIAFLTQGMSPQVVSKATDAAFAVLMKAEAPSKAAESASGGQSASADAGDKSVEALKLKAKRIVALAGASLRAKSMAVTEEKALQKLVAQVAAKQMSKLDRKLKTFEKLEELMMNQRNAAANPKH